MIEDGIKEVLAADSVVNATVAGRIRPMLGAQLDKRPFLTYMVTGGGSNSGEGSGVANNGASAYHKVILEVGIYGDSYTDVATLSKQVKRVLDGIAVNTTTVRIVPSVFADETDVEKAIEPGKQVPVFVRTQSYRILYRDIADS
jgi:hypothetical protein